MKLYLSYTLLTVAVIAGAAVALGFAFRGPGDAAALRLSAVIASVVQIATFGWTRRLAAGRAQMIVGWVAGALVRFVTLAVFGLLVLKVIPVAPAAALIGLASFFFLTTLFEPLFLRR